MYEVQVDAYTYIISPTGWTSHNISSQNKSGYCKGKVCHRQPDLASWGNTCKHFDMGTWIQS